MADTIFLDVNIFMYAAGAEHRYKSPSEKILTDVETGILKAAINVEVLQELLYRYSHIRLADKGLQLCRKIMKYPLTILPVTEIDLRLALDLFEDYQITGLKSRDAIHAATMQNNGFTKLLTQIKTLTR